MKVCFETYGCRLNRAEALDEEAQFLARGWERTERHDDADLIIIRGCSVTAGAQRDCERLIEHIRRKYPLKKLLVRGCLEKRSDEVSLRTTLARLNRAAGDSTDVARAVSTRTARAYLKVQDGCSGKCTFCIVPKFRGKSVSVPFTELMDKAKRFIDAGYHEIVVTGCNLSLYASEGKRLPELASGLAGLGDCRIRIGSVEPGECAMDLVAAMAENERICRFLHLPVQSGSNRVLMAMQRPHLVQDVEKLVEEAVRKMPLIGLGCDLMTGFPGETEAEFISTEGLLRRLPFSNAHVFPYSERPGTLAAGLPMSIPKDVRTARAHVLSDLATSKRKKFAHKFIGEVVKVIVENEEHSSGWTGEYFRAHPTNRFTKERKRPARKTVMKIAVEDVHDDRLVGRLLPS